MSTSMIHRILLGALAALAIAGAGCHSSTPAKVPDQEHDLEGAAEKTTQGLDATGSSVGNATENPDIRKQQQREIQTGKEPAAK